MTAFTLEKIGVVVVVVAVGRRLCSVHGPELSHVMIFFSVLRIILVAIQLR